MIIEKENIVHDVDDLFRIDECVGSMLAFVRRRKRNSSKLARKKRKTEKKTSHSWTWKIKPSDARRKQKETKAVDNFRLADMKAPPETTPPKADITLQMYNLIKSIAENNNNNEAIAKIENLGRLCENTIWKYLFVKIYDKISLNFDEKKNHHRRLGEIAFVLFHPVHPHSYERVLHILLKWLDTGVVCRSDSININDAVRVISGQGQQRNTATQDKINTLYRT